MKTTRRGFIRTAATSSLGALTATVEAAKPDGKQAGAVVILRVGRASGTANP